MAHQQRRYQWPWVWLLALGALGITLVGCGTSSAPTEHSQSTTIRVVFPNQQAALWDQDLPDATPTSPASLPARVLRQAGSLGRFLEVREASAQALSSSIASLVLRVTDASGTPLPGLENVNIPLSTSNDGVVIGRVTVDVPIGPARVFIVEAFLACPVSVRARNFTGQTQADVPSGGTTITINMAPTDEVVVASPGDQSSTPGQAIAVTLRASAAHCTPLTFSASNLPPGLSIDPRTGVISGTPSPEAAGTYPAIITISDGTHTTTTTVTWTVSPLQVPLQVTQTGTGNGMVTSSPAGIDCGTTCSASFAFGTDVTLSATPATGSTFTGWSGEGCSGTDTCRVSMTQARTVTATFTLRTFTVTVQGAGNGSGAVTGGSLTCTSTAGTTAGTCTQTVNYGDALTLSASPATSSNFSSWSGACSGAGTCPLTNITANQTVTATFTLRTFTVTVQGAGNGSGAVTGGSLTCTSTAGTTAGTCTQTVNYGDALTLSASPATSSNFSSWSGACSGAGTCPLTNITANQTVTATFTLRTFTVTVQGAGNGSGAVTGGSLTCTSTAGTTAGTCTQTVNYGDALTLSASPATSSNFSSWSGACSGAGTCPLTNITANQTVTATFTLRTFTVTVQGAGNGSGTVTGGSLTCTSTAGTTAGTCTQTVNYGDALTLSASPATSSNFSSWSGACTGAGTCPLTNITANQTVIATFTLRTFTVTVQGAGNGSGTVTGGSLNCTSTAGTTAGTCTQTVNYGASLTLSAAPATSATFAGWSMPCSGPGPCNLTNITADQTVIATFTLRTFTVTVQGAGTGTGLVTDGTITCTSTAGTTAGTCTQTVNYGASLTLSASPAVSSTFAGWSGACAGTSTCPLTNITADQTVTATFTLRTFTVTVQGAGTGTGLVTDGTISCTSTAGTTAGTCTQTVNYGASLTLSAAPVTSSNFSSWSMPCSGPGPCNLTNITADQTVTATFTLRTFTVTVQGAGSGTGLVTDGTITCTSTAGTTAGTCTQTVNYGASLTLSASPATSSNFSSWSVPCSGTSTCPLTNITADQTVTATFTLRTFTVTVQGAGSGTGLVTDGTITCTSTAGTTAGTCTQTVNYGASLTLSASPAVSSTFAGWSGACAGTSTCPLTNITADQTVTATFTLRTFTVTVQGAGTGTGLVTDGTITCTSTAGTTAGTCTQTVNYGASLTLSAAPAISSTFAGWSGACVGTSCNLTNITTNQMVTASFAITTFTVTPSAGANGSLSPATPQTVNYNATTVFTVMPNIGYRIASVTGCGGTLASGTPTTYTTGAITADCTVTASFAITTFTVTPSAGANGSLSPATPQTVNYNATTVFTVMPNIGYRIASVTGCGGTLASGTPTTYTTGAITADCTVTASFAITTFTVTPSAGANGSLSPATPQTVNYNATTVFTVMPNIGYRIASVTGCGGTLASGTPTTYTTGAITADCTVTASFAITTFTVTPSAGANGSLSPATPQTVNYNATTVFTVMPNIGYRIASVTGCGGTLASGTPTTYTTGAITADCTVTASFAITTFTVTPSAGANGSLSPATPQTVNYNATTVFTVMPNIGYRIASVTGCGGTLASGTPTTYTTGAITADCTVTASFTLQQFTLTVNKTGTGSGTVTSSPAGINCGSPPATCAAPYDSGTVVTLTAQADIGSGSVFAGWSGGGCTVTGEGTCTVTLTANTMVTATFNQPIAFNPQGVLTVSNTLSALLYQPSSALSVLVSGPNVVSYVPKGNGGSGATNVAVVNVEGSSITPQQITTPHVVNACASNSLTGQTVCTANTTDVYVISGTTLTSTLTSAGSGSLFFSGDACTNCGVAMDTTHNKAVIALSLSGGVGGYQSLDLGAAPTFEPAFTSQAPSGTFATIARDVLIDPLRNLILSPNEHGNFAIISVATTTSPVFFENAISGTLSFTAAGEDCTTGIALAPAEDLGDPSQLSTVYLTDLTQATFTPGSPGTWSAPSQVQTLSESFLSGGASGIAVAQGTYTGIVTGALSGAIITAIALPTTSGSGTPALSDWVTCSIPGGFSTGFDPHTVTAYQSPNGGHAIGLVANEGATTLAVVDLTMMLHPTIVPRTVGGHACAAGTLPATVVSTIAVP